MEIIKSLFKDNILNTSTLFLLPLLNTENNFNSPTRSFFNVLYDVGLINVYIKDLINIQDNSNYNIYLVFENKKSDEFIDLDLSLRDFVFNILKNKNNFIADYDYENYEILVFSLFEYSKILNNFYEGKYSNFQDSIIKLYSNSNMNLLTKKRIINTDFHIEYIIKVIKKDEKLKSVIEDFFKCSVNELHSVNHNENILKDKITKFDFYKSNQFFKNLINNIK